MQYQELSESFLPIASYVYHVSETLLWRRLTACGGGHLLATIQNILMEEMSDFALNLLLLGL